MPSETKKKNTRAEQARINGAKSKGATTEAGKANAQKGNLKHGAYAAHSKTALPQQDPDAYAVLCDEIKDELRPAGALESELVQDIVDLSWQIRRLKTAVSDRLLHIDDLNDRAVLILERRLRQCRAQRSKLILDLQRLKRLAVFVESSQEAMKTKDNQRQSVLHWVNPVTGDFVDATGDMSRWTRVPPENRPNAPDPRQ